LKNELLDFIEILKCDSEYIFWIKVSLKNDKSYIIGTMYIPPRQSKFFNEDEL
jgi:hypothetical protein